MSRGEWGDLLREVVGCVKALVVASALCLLVWVAWTTAQVDGEIVVRSAGAAVLVGVPCGRMGLRDRLAAANAAAKAAGEKGRAERQADQQRLREQWADRKEQFRDDMAQVRAEGEANRAEVAEQNRERMDRVRADREGRKLGGFGRKRKP